jgi:hypothetical protein
MVRICATVGAVELIMNPPFFCMREHGGTDLGLNLPLEPTRSGPRKEIEGDSEKMEKVRNSGRNIYEILFPGSESKWDQFNSPPNGMENEIKSRN